MRKLLILSALASLLFFAAYEDASARGGGFHGGGFGGGFRGGGFGGGFRGGGFGGGFRGGGFGGGYRGAALGGFRGGYVGRGYWGGSRYLGGARLAYGGRYLGGDGLGYGGRYLGGSRLAYGGRYWGGRGYWPYRRYGYAFPLAAGLAFAAAGPYYGSYGSSCLQWDGWRWVNACYDDGYAPYSYGGYGDYY